MERERSMLSSTAHKILECTMAKTLQHTCLNRVEYNIDYVIKCKDEFTAFSRGLEAV